MTMTKQYEWKVEQFAVSDFGTDINQEYIKMNLSQEGYKLHTVVPYESVGNYITFIFEREKKPEVTWDDYDDVDNGVDQMREQEALSREEDDDDMPF
jgi:hypothetical protein